MSLSYSLAEIQSIHRGGELTVDANNTTLFGTHHFPGNGWATWWYLRGSNVSGRVANLMHKTLPRLVKKIEKVRAACHCYDKEIERERPPGSNERVRHEVMEWAHQYGHLDFDRVRSVVKRVIGVDEKALFEEAKELTALVHRRVPAILLEEAFGGAVPYPELNELASGRELETPDIVTQLNRCTLSVDELHRALKRIFPAQYVELERMLLRQGCYRLLGEDKEQIRWRNSLGEQQGYLGAHSNDFRIYDSDEPGKMRIVGPNRVTLAVAILGVQRSRFPGLRTDLEIEVFEGGRYAEMVALKGNIAGDSRALTLVVRAMVHHGYTLSRLATSMFRLDEQNRVFLVADAERRPFSFRALENFVLAAVGHSPEEYRSVLKRSGMSGSDEARTLRLFANAVLDNDREGIAFYFRKLEDWELQSEARQLQISLTSFLDLREGKHSQKVKDLKRLVARKLVGTKVFDDWL